MWFKVESINVILFFKYFSQDKMNSWVAIGNNLE